MLPHGHRRGALDPLRLRPDAAARPRGSRPRRRGPARGLSGGALLPARARQRRQPDQVRALHLRRLHPGQHHHREVHYLGAGHRQRTVAGTGRSFAADRRRAGLAGGTPPQALAPEPAADCAGGRGRRTGGGLQYAHRRGAVRDRRSDRTLERRGAGRGGAGRGFERGGRALVPRRRAAVPRSRISPGEPRGTGCLRHPGGGGRAGLNGVRQVHPVAATVAQEPCRAGRNTCCPPSPAC